VRASRLRERIALPRFDARALREDGTQYVYLLATMVFFMMAGPVVSQWPGGRLIMEISISTVLISSVLAASERRSRLALVAIFALVTFLSHWSDHLLHEPNWLKFPPLISGLLFFLMVILALVRNIFTQRDHITLGFLCGAASVYFLLAIFFAYAFALVDNAIPESYQGRGIARIAGETRLAPYLYFSFTTLTTLGYGDIVPANRLAGMLSCLEAVTSQMYLALLVGRLVGMRVINKVP
jgi:voltage-gated potassium channel